MPAEKSAVGFTTLAEIAASARITATGRSCGATKRPSWLAGDWTNEHLALKTGRRGNVAPAGDGHMPGWLQLAVVAPVGAGTPAGCRAEKTLAQQTGLITTLRADDARNRAMMAEQQRREQQLRQQGENYQRKLRDALKGSKCGNSPMPAAVVELLQQNATGTPASRPVTP